MPTPKGSHLSPEHRARISEALRQEFLNLVLEAAETGDKSKLAAWWRSHFPGYKMWLWGPYVQCCVPPEPDDGRDESSLYDDEDIERLVKPYKIADEMLYSLAKSLGKGSHTK